MDLICVQPAVIAPVSEAELLDHLRLDADNLIVSTGYIRALLNVATLHAENVCRRAFITQQWKLYLDELPMGRDPITIPRPRLQKIDSITYTDAETGTTITLNTGLYIVSTGREPAQVVPAYGISWPVARALPGSVEITFTAGYGDKGSDVPLPIRQWILMNAGALYENPESESFVNGNVSKIDASTIADGLLASYRVIQF